MRSTSTANPTQCRVNQLLAHPRLRCGVYCAKRRTLQVREERAGCRYAVIGAGFAGWAVAYHLLDKAPQDRVVEVHVFDAVGVGAGGSGAAAGLLHPFSPNGKLLWRAPEAMQHALHLLERAQEAAAAEGDGLPLTWPTGMVRPAPNLKQSQSFYQQWGHPPSAARPTPSAGPASSTPDTAAGAEAPNSTAASRSSDQGVLQGNILQGGCLSMQQAQSLVPGLAIPAAAAEPVASEALLQQQHQQGPVEEESRPRKQRKQQQQQRKVPPGWSLDAAAALHAPGGITLHPLRYMHALHGACRRAAAGRRAPGSCVQLHVKQLGSVDELLGVGGGWGSWDGVVVAAGAAVSSLTEFSGLAQLLDLCQGYTLDLQPGDTGTTAAAAAAAAGGEGGGGSAGASLAQQRPASAVQQQQEVYGQGSAAELTIAGPLPVSALLATSDGVTTTTTTTTSSCSSSSRQPPCPLAYPPEAPSILGQPYLASQGGQLLVLGASQEHGWDAAAALKECYSRDWLQQLTEAAATAPASAAAPSKGRRAQVLAAAQKLLQGAAAVWPPVATWRVTGVRSGVRALPPRGPQGSIPLVGTWHPLPSQTEGIDCGGSIHATTTASSSGGGGNNSDDSSSSSTTATSRCSSEITPRPPVWLCVGLGARGLVYHAWLGALVAQGVLDNSEQHIPAELLAWQQARRRLEVD